MKKALIAALAAVMMLSVVGCNSSGNDANAENSTAAGSVKEPEVSSTVRTLVGSWYHEMGYTYIFREDKTGEYLVDGNDEPFWVFTYETDGDKLTMYEEDGSILMETKYAIDGDTLIIEDSFGEKVYYTYKA